MPRTLLVAFALVWKALALGTLVSAEPAPKASRWIPQDAIAVIEVSRPKALVDLISDSALSRAVTASPAFQAQTSTKGFKQFVGGVRFLEVQLETDWPTGLGQLLGGGATMSVHPDNAVTLCVDAEDGKMLAELHEILVGFARGGAANKAQSDRVLSREYNGVTVWTFGKNDAHAIVGNRLLLSNKPETLKKVLDLRAEGGPSLADLPAYRAAQKAAPPNAAATAFVNLEGLKQHPPIQKALAQSDNPMIALLFGAAAEAVRGSDWLALGLSVESDGLVLDAAVDDASDDPSELMAFAGPDRADGGALPNISVPREIAGLSFYRDLHGFYATKDELFPNRTSGLIFFENMMGIFFTGRDLTDEVLGETGPEIRFVVAEQEYDPAIGTPMPQVPAFAAVMRLRNPEEFSIIMEEAWQKAIGLVNFTRGQQALRGLIIDRPIHSDVKYTVAYFAPPGKSEASADHARFNFSPSLAMFGEYLILSSTDGLTADLIDAIEGDSAASLKPMAGVHSAVEIHTEQLASVLRANRESLITQNMVKEGNTREKAESEIDVLLMVLDSLGQLKFEAGTDQGHARASLTIEWP